MLYHGADVNDSDDDDDDDYDNYNHDDDALIIISRYNQIGKTK